MIQKRKGLYEEKSKGVFYEVGPGELLPGARSGLEQLTKEANEFVGPNTRVLGADIQSKF